MVLNHLNLPVADVYASRDFYAKYFGLVTVADIPKVSLVIMRDDSGFVLNLSHFDEAAAGEYHKDFHVGFVLPTRAEVDEVHARMVADGIEVKSPSRLPGRWSFYVRPAGGALTEVASYEGAKWAS